MTVETVRAMLGWCVLINWALLLWWWLFIAFAHDRVFALHTKWFKISEERFSEIHYNSMAVFKLGVMIFNLAPYLALRIVA